MPKINHFTKETVEGLRAGGLSLQQTADRLGASLSTIKRMLRESVTDTAVLTFTKKLEALIAEVPDEYCAKEVRRTVHAMRRAKFNNNDRKYRLIVKAMATGASELEEIAEDCFIAEKEAQQLLAEMIDKKLVEKYRPRQSPEDYYRLINRA